MTKLKIIVGLALLSTALILGGVLVSATIILKRNTDTKNLEKSVLLGTPTPSPITFLQSQPNTSSPAQNNPQPTTIIIPYSQSDLLSHNTPSDCWMTIDRTIYNVSNYLALHPGGAFTMTPYCGKDATQAFMTKDKTPASAHSQLAVSLLSKYKVAQIGDTKQTITIIPTLSSQSFVSNPTLMPSTTFLPTQTPSRTPTSTPVPLPTSSSSSHTYTVSEVFTHNSNSNCWMIINNSVYNFTSYLVSHPGGVAVVSPYCGHDGTSGFVTKDHTPGSNHSAYAYSLLPTYYLGSLSTALPTLTPTPIPPTRTPTPTPPPGSTSTPIPTATPTLAPSALSSAAVATHNTRSNCWIIVSNKVYDISRYLVDHPGGISVVEPYCGKESTSGFATKGPSGSDHSAYAYALLANYLLGNLGGNILPTSVPTNTPLPTSTPQPPTFTPAPTSTPIPPTPTSLPRSGVLGDANGDSQVTTFDYSIFASEFVNKSGISADFNRDGRVDGLDFIIWKNKYLATSFPTSTSIPTLTLRPTASLAPTAPPLTQVPTTTIRPTATATLRPTSTPVPPTNTPVPTSVPLPTSTPRPTATPTSAASGYTTAQVATHNTASDCWMIASGKVYNLTSYLTKHPGGVNEITPYCGKDGTTAYNNRGGTGKHSSSANNQLATYFIGNLL